MAFQKINHILQKKKKKKKRFLKIGAFIKASSQIRQIIASINKSFKLEAFNYAGNGLCPVYKFPHTLCTLN